MHVAIKQTILDKILERIHQIKRQNREPEYIAVTPEEYRELCNDLRVRSYLRPDYLSYHDSSGTERIRMGGLTFETREFRRRPGTVYDPSRRYPAYRTYSREKFMDLPLYVVPPEYMPV